MMKQPVTNRIRVLPNREVPPRPEGRLEIVARAGGKDIYHRWQVAPSNGLNADGWQLLGGLGDGEPVLAQTKDGRLDIYLHGTDGNLYVKWQKEPGGPSGWDPPGGDWQSLGRPGAALASDPVVAANADGRLHVFARCADNVVYHKWHKTDGTGYLDVWHPLPGTVTSDLVVAQNNDGRLEVFAIDAAGKVRNIWQFGPDQDLTWNESWGVLEGKKEGTSETLTFVGNPSAGLNQDGRLEVYALATDGQLYLRWQYFDAGGTHWNPEGWRLLGKPPTASLDGNIVVAENLDHRLEIFCLGSDQAIWHIWQNGVNGQGGWSGPAQWESLGNGTLVSPPAVGRNADGRFDVYARATDSAIWVRWQGAPGGGWNPDGWHSIGGGLINF
jgi:hypothetical protein